MTTETVLTDDDLVRILKFGASSITMGRAIEQAVLQSTQLQQRMNAYATARVREALGEAALMCEALDNDKNSPPCRGAARFCALRVRSLIPDE